MRFVALLMLGMACDGGEPTPDDTDSPVDTDETDLPDDTDPADDTDPPDDTDPGDTDLPNEATAVVGVGCPVDHLLGSLEIGGEGLTSVSGEVYDRQHPWYGPPEESTATCDFHRHTASACGPCPSGTICGVSGQCEDEPHRVKDAWVELASGAQTQTVQADAVTGQLYGQVTIGDGSAYSLRLGWGDVEITVPELTMPVAPFDGEVTMEGDYDAPGALAATWTPRSDGAFVGTKININHHAAGPTFTVCQAPGDAGGFAATATMINPLAVSTGLEFQGIDVHQIASAWVRGGCVEVRMGKRHYVQPNP